MTDEQMTSHLSDELQTERLRAIMHRLRAPGGCPWDAEQTHTSLVPNLIEEAYETVDAIQSNNISHMKEELGDLLLQVIFHSELASEENHFTFDDVARAIADKLVHRHPHVFGSSAAQTSDAVLAQWDEIKRKEKGTTQEGFLHGVGHGLPALLRAAKLQKKAAKTGFDWSDENQIVEKIREEISEYEQATEHSHREEELGDLLFSVINLIRFHKLDPEVILHRSNNKFEDRFHKMESSLKSSALSLQDASIEEMEEHWRKIKG